MNHANANPTSNLLRSSTLRIDNDLNDTNKNSSKEMVWSIQRGDDPICEWTKNNALIAGCFPCLFLRGGKMLPSSTFYPS